MAKTDRVSDEERLSWNLNGFDHDSVLLLEANAVFTCMNSEDWHEGIRAFAENRRPVFKGK